MNAVFPRMIKSAYRKEPLITILITMGIVDALIGGLDDSWALFVFGLGTAGIALVIRWWKMEQRVALQENNEEPVKQLYLPERSSKSALPMLSISKKKPPQ
ncbi:hypothetical protein IQ247_25760 [Plectonema cf. radiosum LEGE 06105]|uniref:Uncharacterized protein n=1 Tax=Plectonema cf. radiosum LEGE 06105 TaxID=945769 RepID=A0A8J7FM77_9CYAN|nr:hypothetical protein [Plectonema radiosum]MBE9216026.1 hypothetical protein [Plectonema cf. radiosum LEGE 06105]